jgi:hypothetical protein
MYGNKQRPGPEQAAEKVCWRAKLDGRFLQGLKPDIDWIGLTGTTEVVP